MIKNTLNKFLIFNMVLASIAFLASPARAECNMNTQSWPDFEACMETACMSKGAYYKKGSAMCITCKGKTKPSNKLQNCVDKNMSAEEEEQKYQEKQAAEAAERERIKASCTGNRVYDPDQNRCVFDPSRSKNNTENNSGNEGDGDDGPGEGAWKMEEGAGGTVVPNAVDPMAGSEPTEGEGDAYDGLTEEEEAADANGNSYTMTTNTRINDNGNVTETTDSSTFTVNDGVGTTGGNGTTPTVDLSSIPTSGVTGFTTPPNIVPTDEELAKLKEKTDKVQAEEDAKKREELLKQYTGLYNGRQILPDIMARHCMIKGEEVAKDVSLYINCIKQYVSEMNSSNAAAKAKAQEEFEILRYKGLLDAASNAMTKSQSVLNYENTMNEYNKADQEMQTEFDDNHALMATMSFVTDVLNSFRELQAEQLKYLAINGIVNVDPAVVLADEEEEEEEKEPASNSSGGGDAEIHNVDANTTIKQN